MRIHLPGDQGGLFGGHALGEDATATTSGATSTGEPAPTMLSGLPELQREGLEEAMEMSSMANDWLSYMLMFIGWALLVGAFLSYYKAWRWSKRMRCEQDDATNAAAGANATPAQQASIPLFDAEAAVRTDQEIQNNLRRAGLM